MVERRIHFIGGSGSGKSYLARKFSREFGLPTLDLDDIFWSKEAEAYGTKASDTERDAALQTFLQNPNWIVEGVFYRWLLASFTSATHIIVLTTPLWLRQVRIVRRSIRRRFGFESSKKESLRDLFQLLAWNRGYDHDNLVRALAMLDEQGLHYVTCRNAREVDQALRD